MSRVQYELSASYSAMCILKRMTDDTGLSPMEHEGHTTTFMGFPIIVTNHLPSHIALLIKGQLGDRYAVMQIAGSKLLSFDLILHGADEIRRKLEYDEKKPGIQNQLTLASSWEKEKEIAAERARTYRRTLIF